MEGGAEGRDNVQLCAGAQYFLEQLNSSERLYLLCYHLYPRKMMVHYIQLPHLLPHPSPCGPP